MGLCLRLLMAWLIVAPAVATSLGDSERQGSEQVYDLSIEDAVALAEQRSFKVARATRNLSASKLRYENARSQYLPTLTTGLSASQQARDSASSGGTFAYQLSGSRDFQVNASATVSMPIDVGGVIGRQVRQADLSRDIATDDVADTALGVTLDVQSSYLAALRAQNDADADEAAAKEIGSLLARAGPKSAVANFLQVELANARQTAQSSRENADNAQDSLKQALRIPPEAHLRLTSDFRGRKEPFEREGLLDRALRNRPDVQSAELRVKQARTSVQQVSDYRRPTVRVGAFANQQLASETVYNGTYDGLRQEGGLLSVNVPLVEWDNGQLRRNKEIANLQQQQSDADLEELRERVAYDVRQQLLAVERAENRIRNLPDPKQALQVLQRAEVMLLSAPPETAQGLVAQVSNARQAWRSAETATADAYIDYNLAVFKLKRLIGDQDHVPTTTTAGEIPVQTVGGTFGL